MAAISSILGALSLADEIVGGVNTVMGLFRGGPTTARSLTAGQASLLSGGTAGRVLSTGTSVGPVGGLAGGGFQRAVDIGRQVAVTALPLITGQPSPVPAFLQREVAGQGGIRTMSRAQFILATARANSPGATRRKIVKAAKDCGIELAAATFGLSVIDICFLLAQPPSRRSRGISAADMRRTRSTIRKVTTIQQSLKTLSGPIRRYGGKK